MSAKSNDDFSNKVNTSQSHLIKRIRRLLHLTWSRLGQLKDQSFLHSRK